MKRIRAFAAVSGLALLVTGTAAAQERFALSGQDVSVYNLAGRLQIVSGTGSSTEVEITRLGRDSGELTISTPSPSSLRVIYPRDEIVYRGHTDGSESSLAVSDDGTFGDGRGGRTVRVTSGGRAGAGAMEAAADIVVRLQPGARLTARTVIGNTHIQNVAGELTISNTAGAIAATGTRGELTLRTASGDIGVRDVEGTVNLRTASGSIDVENARGAELTVRTASGVITANSVQVTAVQLQTASGSISADRINSDRLQMAAASGRITARETTAPEVQARTSSGALDVQLEGTVRAAQLRSASGSVRLQLPLASNVELELRSASGTVHLDAHALITESRRGYTVGTLGAGTGRVSATSASGSVRISAR